MLHWLGLDPEVACALCISDNETDRPFLVELELTQGAFLLRGSPISSILIPNADSRLVRHLWQRTCQKLDKHTQVQVGQPGHVGSAIEEVSTAIGSQRLQWHGQYHQKLWLVSLLQE